MGGRGVVVGAEGLIQAEGTPCMRPRKPEHVLDCQEVDMEVS